MSAQAVLSILTPAHPASPRGPSGARAPGFESLLATVVSDGDASSSAETAGASAPPEKAADDSNNPAEVGAEAAVAVPPIASPPMALPPPNSGTVSGDQDGTGPQVLPGAAVAKADEALVLPGAGAETATQLQILARPANARGGAALVPPGPVTAKGAEPLVLPGSATEKGAEPQILPDEPPTDAASQGASGADVTKASPSGEPPSAPARPGAVPAPPALPPLRPLAERTSKPLIEAAKSGEAAPPAAQIKPAGAAAPQAPAPTDQPTRTAAPTADAAPLEDPAAALAEAGPATDAGSPRAETAAPVRDHTLSTLSRATIDATAQIAAQILRKLEGRSTRFEIALRPDELGRVDVKLDIDSEGRLAARLAFDNPAAATDLRGRADELRRQLEAAGFQLADDAFEFAERDSGSSTFDRGQDARHGQSRAFAAATRLNNEIDVAQPPKWLALSLSPSGVDMKV